MILLNFCPLFMLFPSFVDCSAKVAKVCEIVSIFGPWCAISKWTSQLVTHKDRASIDQTYLYSWRPELWTTDFTTESCRVCDVIWFDWIDNFPTWETSPGVNCLHAGTSVHFDIPFISRLVLHENSFQCSRSIVVCTRILCSQRSSKFLHEPIKEWMCMRNCPSS